MRFHQFVRGGARALDSLRRALPVRGGAGALDSLRRALPMRGGAGALDSLRPSMCHNPSYPCPIDPTHMSYIAPPST